MYTLVVCGTDGQVVQRLPIGQGEWLIGRQDGNHVVLPSASVSRQHARIYTAQRKCFIQDLKSSNGVVIDGRRIAEVEELRPAQRVQIGDFQLFLKAEGTPDPPPAAVMSTHIVDHSREYARIVGLSGPFEGEEFQLTEKENTIGRTEDNLILLPDASVSRQHARIVIDDNDRHVIYDLHSSNGSYVNRKRVNRAVLRDGDVVTIGNVAFRFVTSRGGGRRAKAGAPRGRAVLVIGLIVTLLLMAGATVGLVLYKSHKRKEAREHAQAAYQQAVASGKNAVANRQWEPAIEDLSRALQHNPSDLRLTELLAKAKTEKDNEELVKKGDRLSSSGKLEEAIQTLRRIPATSAYAARAKQKLDGVRAQLAQSALAEGLEACKRRRRARCHELLVKSLDLDPTNADALKRLRSVEKDMRRKRIPFDRWEPRAAGTPR